MHIEVYSDGSATTNDKPGGYGWVMVIDGKKHDEGSGHMENASNNDAELQAAIMGLAAVLKFLNSGIQSYLMNVESPPTDPLKVTLVSDSQIVLNWASGAFRFKQLDKIKKYEQLRTLMQRLKADTRWVRGHSGDPHNERCDRLANYARVGAEPVEELTSDGDTLIGLRKDGIIAIWFKNKMKLVDLANNVCEDYNRETHGVRESVLELRDEKKRAKEKD